MTKGHEHNNDMIFQNNDGLTIGHFLLANEQTEVATTALITLLENGFNWLVRDQNDNTFEENINQAPYLTPKQIDMIQESCPNTLSYQCPLVLRPTSPVSDLRGSLITV